MEGLNWVVSVLGSLLGLLATPVLGVPMYVYFMIVFVFGLLADFLHGRK